MVAHRWPGPINPTPHSYDDDPDTDVVIDGAMFGMPGWRAVRHHCIGYSMSEQRDIDHGWMWNVEPPAELDGMDIVDRKKWSDCVAFAKFVLAVEQQAEEIEEEEPAA